MGAVHSFCRLSAFAIALLLHGTAMAAGDQFVVGNWEGQAGYSDDTGKFLQCTMTADYGVNDLLGFTISSEGVFLISVANAAWSLETGHSYPVRIKIDDMDFGRFTAKAISDVAATIPVNYSTAIRNAIRKGRVLSIVTARQVLRYALTDTYRALPRLEDCVLRSRLAERESGNPFAEMTPSNPFSGASGTARDVSHISGDTVKALLAASGISDYLYLDAQQREALFPVFDHAWIVGQSVGGIVMIPNTGLNLDTLSPLLFSLMASSCDSKVSQASTNERVTPKVSVTRGLLKCTAQGQDVLLVVQIWPRSDNSMMAIIHISSDFETREGIDADQKIFAVLRDSVRDAPPY